ncbi:primosomal protein N' [Apibacter muscae]|uniref:replication restart helicase PriA n=1 Tax=Apibacter muscae TaxID=2509004 RepID=UPI0011AB8F60|nr:primosomal protein N' [Apibacter muscae]TWP22951.1 primosomal protein N' [Apibacter muscae]
MEFVNVILPLPIKGVFTYHVPKVLENSLQIGQRVVVPFGGKKLYTGIILEIHKIKPELYKTKEIFTILENEAFVTISQLNFWKWISEYYLCTLGDVYRNAFPSALKLESETYIRKTGHEIIWEELDEREIFVMQNLEVKTSIDLKEIESFISKKHIVPTIKSLFEKNLVELDEQIIEKYKPKQMVYLDLNPDFKNSEIFKRALLEIDRAPKQREAFLVFIQWQQQRTSHIGKRELVDRFSPAVVKGLIDRNFLIEFQLQIDRIEDYDDNIEDFNELSEAQNQAFHEIRNQFSKYNTVLLQGVTSSGKTEIYFHLIDEQLKLGKNCLLLLPEISITTQLVTKIQKRFGNEVGVYHSKLNQNERVEVWKNTLNNKYKILIGARSIIFLPIQNIGLIIVDEEHDSSYKQSDTLPLYNARDCVQILAHQFKAKVLLGSATPSMESYYNCDQGKFGFVELNQRFGEIKLPEVDLVSLRTPTITPNISYELYEQIKICLENKKQVILFHNRRGFSPILECNQCGHSPTCPNCDVSLTYHKVSSTLRCHYCGNTRALPQTCPSCHSHSLETKGIGTQQIEEEIIHLFPEARVARMDVDTMKRKHAYEILFEKMHLHEIDILIGTQMVTKGLDFDSIQLVGVIRADSLLNFPNFRAEERTLQLLTQVSGRAGRREAGKVLIQTFDPENPLYLFIQENNYHLAKDTILQERKEFLYPPYYRLIEITFKHKKQDKAKKTATFVVEYLRNFIQEPFILGPEEGLIPRINNYYIYKVLLKHPANKSTKNLKFFIEQSLTKVESVQAYRSVKITIDVDPL